MKTSTEPGMNVVIFASVIFLFALIVSQSAQAEDVPVVREEKLTLLDCQEIVNKITKKVYKKFAFCSKEVKKNSTGKDYQKKMGCVIKCVLDSVGLLAEDGTVTKESIQGFMDDHIPDEAHEFLHWAMEHCIEHYGSKLDKTEQFCESYGEFTKCLLQVMQDFSAFREAANCKIQGEHTFG